MGCTITSGISISCDGLKRAGGLAKKLWAFNLSDLRVPIDTSISGYITDLELNTYASLQVFEGAKFHAEASSNAQVNPEGGNVSYQHQIIMRLLTTNPTDDATLEDLATSDTVWIVRTQNDEFKIYGGANGMGVSTEVDNTGRQVTDSPVDTITLVGVDRFKPKRLLVGGSIANTLAYLTARQA